MIKLKILLLLLMSTLKYVVLFGGIFTTMFVTLSHIAEYLFIQPLLILHVPPYAVFDFSLIVLVSALTSLVLSMGMYRIQILKSNKKQINHGFIGAIIGTCAGVSCCGSIGFALISSFGAIGVTTTTFLFDYETPLRLLSIGILTVTLFYMIRELNIESKIKSQKITQEILN